MPTEIPLDTIDDVLAHVADAARCWEVNPSIYNDRRLTQLVEQAQEAIARTCPTTETTLRLLQHITPKGLKLAIIQCEGSGAPLIAISIDADQTLRWGEAAGLDARQPLLLGAYLATPGRSCRLRSASGPPRAQDCGGVITRWCRPQLYPIAR